ncbi:hypothetical protein PQF32_12915 [Rhizobium sp. BC56]|nr:hypothetical protein [Rhizobium sp. BC56]MDC7743486.1 hypothetical protein [Rhizobium sp. BC56]
MGGGCQPLYAARDDLAERRHRQSGRRNDNSATASTWSNAKLGLVDRVKTRYGASIHIVGATIIPTMTGSSDSGGLSRAIPFPPCGQPR